MTRHSAQRLGSLLAASLTAYLALIAAPHPGSAQSEYQLRRASRVHVDDVVAGRDGERTVELYLRAETAIGQPVTDLAPSAISIRDNDVVIPSESLEVQSIAEAGVGTSSVLVLDTSRSMLGAPFEHARAAALEFLDGMGDFDQVAIVAFDDGVELVSDFSDPRTSKRVALEQLEVQPKTLSKLVWDGVHEALDLLERRPASLPRRSFIIVLSDGRDSNSVHSKEEVQALASGEIGGSSTPVFSIGYTKFGDSGLVNLEALTAATGGGEVRADVEKSATPFLREIWERMSQSLVVRYPTSMDGRLHIVEVTVGGRTDAIETNYPEIRSPVWPWVLGSIALLAVFGAGAYFFILRSRTIGRLVFEGGPRSGEVVRLAGAYVQIGALEDNDVVLNDPTVSRFHAKIHARRGQLELEDLGSRNGTFVNGTRVSGRSQLQPGDRVQFGQVEMIYRA